MRPIAFALLLAAGCGPSYSCDNPNGSSECDDYVAGFTESSARATCEGQHGFFSSSSCPDSTLRVARCTFTCASSGRTVRGNYRVPYTTDEIRTMCVSPSSDCSVSFEPN